jgi:hypothetical protein
MDAEKRQELLAAKAERDAVAAAAEQAHKDLVLELEDRYARSLGPRATAFEIVNEDNDCGIGPIVVKRAEDVAIKQWEAKDGDSPEDRFLLVRPCVLYPEAGEFVKLTTDRSHLVKRCLNAILRLAGAKRVASQGKY